MLDNIYEQRELGIICYTGYKFEELRNRNDNSITMFLEKIDLLIDRPYVEKLNNNKGLRGSTNQKLHFLTPRYEKYKEFFLNRKRDIEIHLHNKYYLVVGIKPNVFKQNMNI